MVDSVDETIDRWSAHDVAQPCSRVAVVSSSFETVGWDPDRNGMQPEPFVAWLENRTGGGGVDAQVV